VNKISKLHITYVIVFAFYTNDRCVI
jgi:hypothetical protein